ncbi:MAG TPA: RsiV family protein [Candidatus Paceibacterota bacterium]|nr:RsiV family protein [Candidatus Paceibacterota bacterium]
MELKPLPVVAAVVVLALAGGVLWYVLSRPSPGIELAPEGSSVSGPQYITEDGQYHEIAVTYPGDTPLRATAGAQADAAAVALMKTFAEAQIAQFKTDSGLATLTQADIDMMGLGGDRKFAFGMEYETRTSPVTLSYIYLIYADTMGAHPNAYYKTFTFDRMSGEELTIDDLFTPGANFLPVLSETSRAILYPKIAQAMNIPQSEMDTSMIDAGTEAQISNFTTFYLDGADLVLIFPPYQVGPWALGTQEARISRSDLADLLKTRYR